MAFKLFNTLVKGETDLIIYERLMGHDLVKEPGMIFLYLHKKHSDLVPKVAEAVRDMKKEGTFKKITYQTLQNWYITK